MKEQWIEDISTKMDGYEMDAPEISWSEIEGKVAANRRPRIVAMWQRRIAVAASVLMIVAASTTLFFTGEQASTDEKVAKAKVEGKTPLSAPESEEKVEAHANSSASLGKGEKRHLLAASKNLQEKNKNLQEKFENLLEVSENVQEVSSNAQEKTDKAQDQPKATDSHPSANKGKKKTSLDYPEEYAFKKQKTARLMASVYYGNGMSLGSALGDGVEESRLSSDALPSYSSDSMCLENTLTRGRTLMADYQPERMVKHHQPIRIGVSVKYAFSERWGIETGLAYSYLRSDISEERPAYTINSKQKVGYLGIPLAASYNIVNAKPLHLYVLAGTMLEIPVMAKSDEAIVSSGLETTRQERSLSRSGLQLSFSGRVGAEYNLTPSLGIYVEPGVSYYLGNGSSIETAYSDKPFNFNLNLGIRLTFGR